MKHEISLVGLLFLLTAGQAFADPPKPSSTDSSTLFPAAPRRPVSEKERLALVEKGKNLTRDGHYPEAIVELREALAARPDPKVLLWLGYAQEQTGTLLEARASYLEAKSVAHAGKLAGEERNADQALLDIAAKIPRIVVKLSPGVEATIWVDGKLLERAPDGVEVDPGAHRVLASSPGKLPYKASIVAMLGEVQVVEPTLTSVPPPPPELPPAAPPQKVKSDSPTGVFVAGGIGAAVALTLGAGFAITSEVKRQERNKQIDATRGCHGLACEPYNAPERSRGAFLTASIVSFLAAGAIGAGTLTYSLVRQEGKSKREATATVTAGPGGAAGVVSVTW
jgi:hypothetical protein